MPRGKGGGGLKSIFFPVPWKRGVYTAHCGAYPSPSHYEWWWLVASHEKINGHRELTLSSQWPRWSRLRGPMITAQWRLWEVYEDHKLPSVLTRDLARSHESRLAPATRNSLSVTRDLACLAIRDPQVRSANQEGSPPATHDSQPVTHDSRPAIRDLSHEWRVTNRYSPLVIGDLSLLSHESRVTSRGSWVMSRDSRVASGEPSWLADLTCDSWLSRESRLMAAYGLHRGHSSVTARSQPSQSSVTAQSQLSHSSITAQSRHLQNDHSSDTARSQLNHGPGHGSVTAGCDHFGHRELTVSSPWPSRWPIFFSWGDGGGETKGPDKPHV